MESKINVEIKGLRLAKTTWKKNVEFLRTYINYTI